MKRIILVFCAASFIISCGNDSNNTASEGSVSGTASGTTSTDAGTASGTTTPAPAATATADADKGLDLIAASDCLTCHKVEEKLVGPAYREIAAKYPNDQATIDTLASRIINGASGHWGNMVMTPHPQISKEDAQTMVKYIMSLKQ